MSAIRGTRKEVLAQLRGLLAGVQAEPLSAVERISDHLYVLENTPLGTSLVLLGGAALIAFLASWLIGVNRFSMHALYRDRIIRGYLAASNMDRKENPFTGFDPKDIAILENGVRTGLTNEDAVPPKPEQPVSKPGDLWRLGSHRLDRCCYALWADRGGGPSLVGLLNAERLPGWRGFPAALLPRHAGAPRDARQPAFGRALFIH